MGNRGLRDRGAALPAITADTCFVAMSKAATDDLRNVPGVAADRRCDWRNIRHLMVSALHDATVQRDTVRRYNPPRRKANGSTVILASFWMTFPLVSCGQTVRVQCQLLAGSPAGWQRYTLLLLAVEPVKAGGHLGGSDRGRTETSGCGGCDGSGDAVRLWAGRCKQYVAQ